MRDAAGIEVGWISEDMSNADNLAYIPVLYDRKAAVGWIQLQGNANLVNPSPAPFCHLNLPDDQVKHVNWSYMFKKRPIFTGLSDKWNLREVIALDVTLPVTRNPPVVPVSHMDLGFAMYGVHSELSSTTVRDIY
ncbi:unnamed protein product [Rhizoctonia solani]|uniref:Uncharacterized protein n=1 Tax=Rhizoctonia solani TaxID=456999 RepID=A0A8H3DRD8_9AGAM|nr:unnamed protein product [Rhizoctonia solani]